MCWQVRVKVNNCNLQQFYVDDSDYSIHSQSRSNLTKALLSSLLSLVQ